VPPVVFGWLNGRCRQPVKTIPNKLLTKAGNEPEQTTKPTPGQNPKCLIFKPAESSDFVLASFYSSEVFAS